MYIKIKQCIYKFLNNENGSETVEIATLFPIILFVVGFVTDRFIQYEGVTATAAAANEAIRYSVVAESAEEAESVIKETLTDRMNSSSLGWCAGNENNSCRKWGPNISVVNDRGVFEANKGVQALIQVDNKGWCNGSYITLGVRAHKSSLFPSYESFQHMVRNGGPIYHAHTYIVTARVESNIKCAE